METQEASLGNGTVGGMGHDQEDGCGMGTTHRMRTVGVRQILGKGKREQWVAA